MRKYVIVAETGSDVSKELAAQYDIRLVPMHVSFGDETKDDGSFPIEELFGYYETTGILPKTSAANIHDFTTVFDQIHEEYPEAQIIYLAYSAQTTASYQSAVIAGEDRDYIHYFDTRNVTAGQALIVVSTARYIEAHPDVSLEELTKVIEGYIAKTRTAFFVGDLDYLRAGGRVTNAAYMGARILNLHPLIVIKDGLLVADKKYRGSMDKISMKLMDDLVERFHLAKDVLFFVYGHRLSEKIMENAEKKAKEMGFKEIVWVETGSVVSTHGGPGSFGLIGFEE